MKALIALFALLAMTACNSQPTRSNAQLDTQRDPACATCATECCGGSKSEAAVAPKAKASCCESAAKPSKN